MSNILNSEDFGLKIYNRFPPKYREDDVGQKYALKRYIESASEGGFKHAIEDVNGITNLIDPDKVSSTVLPTLFKHYGLEIFNGIPEEYLRYLLPKLGEAWSKKGSLSVIEFITSSLSGIKTSTEVDYDEQDNPLVTVKFEMDYNIGSYFPNTKQFEKLLVNFLPFYCDLFIIYAYMFYESGNLGTNDHTLDTLKLKRIDERAGFAVSKFSSDMNIVVFGESLLGEAMLGYADYYSDQCIDHVKCSVQSESASLSSSIDSAENNTYNTLNGRVITKAISYDIITTKGEQRIVIH